MKIKLAVFLSLTLAGCAAPIHHPIMADHAVVSSVPQGCVLSIESQWPDMVHGPAPLFNFNNTHTIIARLTIPSIHGSYDVKDVKLGYEKENGLIDYISVVKGTVDFHDKQVNINLQQNSDEEIESVAFNGSYLLKNPTQCTTTR
ncbi:MAG: hypothetical protein ACI9FJ_000667 [Alteromonadaceae bacterium]|jgi:hypothetical protein